MFRIDKILKRQITVPASPFILMLTAIQFLALACSSPKENDRSGILNDGKYDGNILPGDISGSIARLAESLKLVNCMAYYNHYEFSKEDKITAGSITEKLIKGKSVKNSRFDRSASGTAVILSSLRGKVTLLTCAHIIDFQDTLYNYYYDDKGFNTGHLESISIKLSQNIFIAEFPKGGRVDILHMDSKQDLAVIGNDFGTDFATSFRVLDYPAGRSSDLNWGTFVYLLGYPSNQIILTAGIVSLSNNMRETFNVDAVINRGFSGGLVMAVRDGIPNLELVGVVKSSPADIQYSIKPSTTYNEQDFDPLNPYKGELFVEQDAVPRYGMTNVISIDRLVKYLEGTEELILKKGYSTPDLIK